MEKLLKFCLNFLIAAIALSCSENPRDLSVEQRKKLSVTYYEKGEQEFSQGSLKSVHWIKQAIDLDSTNSAAWWELSIPYLKRGLPHKWKPLIDKTVRTDPAKWQGWRGYEKLFFYRDYKGALMDFNATDSLTPFTDYPQGMSVDYLRGLAFLGLRDFHSSRKFLDKYVAEVSELNGEEWVDVYAFIHRGVVLDSLGERNDAMKDFYKCLKYYNNSADAHYQLARLYLELNQPDSAVSHIVQARRLFETGYVMQRPYVETFCQIYEADIDSLDNSIRQRGHRLK